jgi:hypothetical protein
MTRGCGRHARKYCLPSVAESKAGGFDPLPMLGQSGAFQLQLPMSSAADEPDADESVRIGASTNQLRAIGTK